MSVQTRGLRGINLDDPPSDFGSMICSAPAFAKFREPCEAGPVHILGDPFRPPVFSNLRISTLNRICPELARYPSRTSVGIGRVWPMRPTEGGRRRGKDAELPRERTGGFAYTDVQHPRGGRRPRAPSDADSNLGARVGGRLSSGTRARRGERRERGSGMSFRAWVPEAAPLSGWPMAWAARTACKSLLTKDRITGKQTTRTENSILRSPLQVYEK